MTETKDIIENAAERRESAVCEAPCEKTAPKSKSAAVFILPAFAALAAAAFFGRSLEIGAAARDVFAGVSSPYGALLCAGALLPILFEFLAVYVFAYSPLCLPACLAALAARGARVGIALRALSSGTALFPGKIAAALYAGAAAALALFAAQSFALSPALRRIGFSSPDGRREALLHTIRFLILSGAAALLLLASALTIHFA